VKRPVLQPTPQPGQLYEWDTPQRPRFLILSVDAKHREIWMCQAIDLQKGCETRIGIRKRDRHNGWYQVCLDAPRSELVHFSREEGRIGS
jgi:hypothetical protein